MITTFEEVWDYMKDIPGSFTRMNAEKYYEYALQSSGSVVEIGVDQGRSASVLCFAARHTGAMVLLVDSWDSVLIDNKAKVDTLLNTDFPDVTCGILHFPSIEASKRVDVPLSLIHIDANHWGDGPEEDCAVWLPKLISGGFACFHDYGIPTMGHAVTDAVNKHTAGWEDLGAWEGLAIRRKI